MQVLGKGSTGIQLIGFTKQSEVSRLQQKSFPNMLGSKILNVDKEIYMLTTGNQHAFSYWACQNLGEVPARKTDWAGKMGFQLHTAIKVKKEDFFKNVIYFFIAFCYPFTFLRRSPFSSLS